MRAELDRARVESDILKVETVKDFRRTRKRGCRLASTVIERIRGSSNHSEAEGCAARAVAVMRVTCEVCGADVTHR